MSHINKIAVAITSLSALEDATRELGGVFRRDQKTHTFYGGQGACEHAIGVEGVRYEIGIVKEEDGSYRPAYDAFGDQGPEAGEQRHDGLKLNEKFGEGLRMLSQRYAVCAASREARRRGWNVQRSTLPNGTIRLEVTGV